MNERILNHIFNTFIFIAEKSNTPETQIVKNNECIWITTGVQDPLFNIVFQKNRLTRESLKTYIHFYNPKKIPFSIWPFHNDDFEILRSLKFYPFGEMIAVGCKMTECKELQSDLSAVEVKKVETLDEMRIWSEIQIKGFNYKRVSASFFSNMLHNSKSLQEVEYYLGYLEGKPVGSSMVYITDHKGFKIAGLWNASVLSSARKKGVGTLMAQKRVEFAKKNKADFLFSLLEPGQMALRYCHQLGLKEMFKLYPFFSPDDF